MDLLKISLLLLTCLICVGCAPETSPGPGGNPLPPADSTVKQDADQPEAEKPAPTPDDAALLKTIIDSAVLEASEAIEAAATSVKKDGDGFITEVNFRGSSVADVDLDKLTWLTRLQSVLLNDAKISDDGLKPLGEILTLRNLDLRGCPISNDGLAHLTNLKNLRALRLSGQNGATEVDDDGMVHIGKLTSLKALLLDFLWVSGDGLAELKDLKNLSEASVLVQPPPPKRAHWMTSQSRSTATKSPMT